MPAGRRASPVSSGPMEPIPEEIVDETLREMSGLGRRRSLRLTRQTERAQPYLHGFVARFSQELRPEAAELLVDMFTVIVRMFQKNAGREIRRVRARRIRSRLDELEEFFGRLQGVHEKFLEPIARQQSSAQPHVMRFIVETLFAVPEGGDSTFLTEDEMGQIFVVLKTVVDLLDDAVLA